MGEEVRGKVETEIICSIWGKFILRGSEITKQAVQERSEIQIQIRESSVYNMVTEP